MPFSQWNQLPTEVQLEILGHLAYAEHRAGASLASYAVVSKSWQAVFEPLTFGILRLSLRDLSQFIRTCNGCRRKIVRHIGIIIDLPEETPVYAQSLHGSPEAVDLGELYLMSRHHTPTDRPSRLRAQMGLNDTIFNSTLYSFLAILALWLPAECHRDGITLELIATSASYWQRLARQIHQRPFATKIYLDQPDTRRPRAITLNPMQRWDVLAAAELNFNMELGVNLRLSRLLTVPAISTFSIRGNTIRNFSFTTITSIMGCFPALTHVDLKLWERWEGLSKHLDHVQYISQLPRWSDSIRRVSIQQRESLDFGTDIRADSPCLRRLGAAFGRLSIRLDYLRVSMALDVEAFMAANTGQWASLEALILRSTRPLHSTAASPLDDVLATVSRALRRMPRLKKLVICHHNHTEASMFACHISEENMQIQFTHCGQFNEKRITSLWQSIALARRNKVEWVVRRVPYARVDWINRQVLLQS